MARTHPRPKRGPSQPLTDCGKAGPKPVLAWFDATQPGTATGGWVLKRERGYFRTKATRMQYPSLREQHGSGHLKMVLDRI